MRESQEVRSLGFAVQQFGFDVRQYGPCRGHAHARTNARLQRCWGGGLHAQSVLFFGDQYRWLPVRPAAPVQSECGGMCNEVSEHVFSVVRRVHRDNRQSGQRVSGVVQTVRFLYTCRMNGSEHRLLRVILAIAMAAVFLPLLSGGFVWDDHLLVVENTLTDSLGNAVAMFQTDLWGATPVPDSEPGYYRPLMLVDLAITRAVAGLNHSAHHLHNLLWHCAAVALLLKLLELILHDKKAATIGAAVFALHPVQIESVGFISARNDPMAVTWLLGAILLLSAEKPKTASVVAGSVMAMAAMLCKESVVFAPLLVAFAARARWGGWGSMRAHAAVFVGFAGALGLRFSAGVGMPAQADAAHLKAVAVPALAFYLDKLVWPVDIAPVIHFGWPPAVPWTTAGVALMLLAVLAVVGGPFARAGLAFAALGLAPAFAAVAHVGAVVDRYMYLPMVGVAWSVAAVAQRPIAGKLSVLGIGCLVLSSSMQVPVWKNEATLWQAAIERAPSGYAKGALARWLEDQGLDADAAFWYQQAVIQPPRPFHESCYNVTRIHLKLGDPARAIEAGQEALDAGCEESPELVAPLALAYALEGQWESADSMARGIGSDPTGKAVLVRLASAAALGDIEPLRAATTDAPAAMLDQVMTVLRQGGADVDSIRKALQP